MAFWRADCRGSRQTHGPWVSEALLSRWGPPGSWLTPSPQALPASVGGALALDEVVRPAGEAPETVPDKETEDDVAGLFHLWWTPVVAVARGAGCDQDANTRVEFFTMARRVLAQLQQQGASVIALASALMELIWRRGDHDYLMEAEEYFGRLDLPVDISRDRADDLGAEAHAAVIWLEAELWQEFIDYLEGMVGETEQVREARGQATMSTGECDRWWQWAAEHAPALPPRPGSRSRSRSRGEGEDPDTASLMDTGRGRPVPKQKPYPGRGGRGRGDDDEDPHDRGDRRDHTRDREGAPPPTAKKPEPTSGGSQCCVLRCKSGQRARRHTSGHT